MTRAVPSCFFDFIKGAEGKIIRPYDDVRPSYRLLPGEKVIGILTGGYGHTGPDLLPWIGRDLPDSLIDLWLQDDAERAAERLLAAIGDVVSILTDHQYAALLSFVFNLGARPSWFIWSLVKEKDWPRVTAEIMKFDHASGVVLAGLENRRSAEVKLFNMPDVIPA